MIDRLTFRKNILTFSAITFFYFFEFAQMTYFNVLAPIFLNEGALTHHQIGALSAAYFYGNMVGLLPLGFLLDKLPLRKILLLAIVGSVLSASLLASVHHFSLQWTARFLCGFFGGTACFLGAIRIIASLFSHRFTFFMGIFLSVGMLGGLVSQYPLLIIANHLGTHGVMYIMVIFSTVVLIYNLFYLQPHTAENSASATPKYSGTLWQMCLTIVKNARNWGDCLLIIFLNLPISLVGSLWGIVLLTNFYYFSASTSAWIVMSLFAGTIIGPPLCGAIADRYQHPAWLVILGAIFSFLVTVLLLVSVHSSASVIAVLFFALGLFTSSQTLVFTWLTKNMRPELIARNSAFNSMLFMASGGIVQQIGAILLIWPSFWYGAASAANLLLFLSITLLAATFYVSLRKKIFHGANQ